MPDTHQTEPPFIGADGLEYWQGRPVESWRNHRIQSIRHTGCQAYIEKNVTDYIIFHDGYDTRPVAKQSL